MKEFNTYKYLSEKAYNVVCDTDPLHINEITDGVETIGYKVTGCFEYSCDTLEQLNSFFESLADYFEELDD